MAFAWCLRHPEVTSVLTAVSSRQQLEDGVRALDRLAFSDEELRRIDAITGRPGATPAR